MQSTELIPISEADDGRQAVMGRDLHEFLEIGQDYTSWFKRMETYGFIAGQDHLPKTSEVNRPQGGTTQRTDHIMTLDMAKEVSMIQRNEKGKQARQYFIEVEKRAKSAPALPQSMGEALRLAADEYDRAEIEKSRADKAEKKADSLNSWKRATEAGDGLKLSDFRAKYFTSVPFMTFFNHLYAKKWVKDERGARVGKDGKKKDGLNHQQPLRKANQFLYRHEQGNYGDKKRLQTRVKPTDEIAFRDSLIAEGLKPNTHSTGLVLFNPEDMKELSA